MAMNVETVLNGNVRWKTADNSETVAIDGSNRLTLNPKKRVHFVSNNTELRLIDSTGYSDGDEAILIITTGSKCQVTHDITASGSYKPIRIHSGGTLANYIEVYGIALAYSSAQSAWVQL